MKYRNSIKGEGTSVRAVTVMKARRGSSVHVLLRAMVEMDQSDKRRKLQRWEPLTIALE